MEERILGKTGIKVKVLGFGGIPIQRVSEKEAIKVISRGYDLGINFFDTARNYTISEERVGKALENVRDNVIIVTKSLGRTKKDLIKDLEASLRDLRTDVIDIFQLHNVSTKEAWKQIKSQNGALEALYKAHDEGKVRHIGITSHNTSTLTEITKEQIFETIQIPFNYLSTLPAEELLNLCKKLNIGNIIMKPFGGGAFSSASTALKYILKEDNVNVVIPGMMSIHEVEENVKIASGSYELSSEELNIIEKDKTELGNQFCRTCDYCQPCPQEIYISFGLNLANALKRMGYSSRFKELYQDLKSKISRCIDCGDCEARCPYHLPIRKLLPARIKSFEKSLKN
ncbi:aldo/keto reductase [[Eubacterium] cellulosolvens]